MRFRLVTCVLLTTLLSGSLLARQQRSFPARLAADSLLLDIVNVGQYLLAVGERGHILRSENGINWQQMSVPSLSTLTAVAYAENSIWAVGHDSTILNSKDKGMSWQVQMFKPELQRPFLDVLFIDKLEGIAVGAYGIFYRTRDGGENWLGELHPEFVSQEDKAYLDEIRLQDQAFYAEEMKSILPHLNRISISGKRLYMAGESGLLAYSDDRGVNWLRMETDYKGSFFDIRQTLSGRLLAAGLRGNIFEFSERIQGWKKLDSGSKSSFNSIVSINTKQDLVVGNNGSMLFINGERISLAQTEEGKAISNAVLFDDGLIAATAIGIKHLQRQSE